MQWRAVLEQLLIFNTARWFLDAAAPTVPYSSSLQDSQVLPVVPVLLVLLMLLFTYHHYFCSGDEQEILDRDFWGCTLTCVHCQSCEGVASAAKCQCGVSLQDCRVHACFHAFPSLLLWLGCVSGLLAAYFTAVSVQLKCNLFFLYH